MDSATAPDFRYCGQNVTENNIYFDWENNVPTEKYREIENAGFSVIGQQNWSLCNRDGNNGGGSNPCMVDESVLISDLQMSVGFLGPDQATVHFEVAFETNINTRARVLRINPVSGQILASEQSAKGRFHRIALKIRASDIDTFKFRIFAESDQSEVGYLDIPN